MSRNGFLETLEETLGFTPKVGHHFDIGCGVCSRCNLKTQLLLLKVDFNAGVVAAGEAQIESTVTGNSSSLITSEKETALRDQSQIYLPINNALTRVGHVHGFLEEIGQGVQHVASRVDDIVSFVQQANDRRKIFGEVSRYFVLSILHCPLVYRHILSLESTGFHVPKHTSFVLRCANKRFDCKRNTSR
jgi:hypothetical protein